MTWGWRFSGFVAASGPAQKVGKRLHTRWDCLPHLLGGAELANDHGTRATRDGTDDGPMGMDTARLERPTATSGGQARSLSQVRHQAERSAHPGCQRLARAAARTAPDRLW